MRSLFPIKNVEPVLKDVKLTNSGVEVKLMICVAYTLCHIAYTLFHIAYTLFHIAYTLFHIHKEQVK